MQVSRRCRRAAGRGRCPGPSPGVVWPAVAGRPLVRAGLPGSVHWRLGWL